MKKTRKPSPYKGRTKAQSHIPDFRANKELEIFYEAIKPLMYDSERIDFALQTTKQLKEASNRPLIIIKELVEQSKGWDFSHPVVDENGEILREPLGSWENFYKEEIEPIAGPYAEFVETYRKVIDGEITEKQGQEEEVKTYMTSVTQSYGLQQLNKFQFQAMRTATDSLPEGSEDWLEGMSMRVQYTFDQTEKFGVEPLVENLRRIFPYKPWNHIPLDNPCKKVDKYLEGLTGRPWEVLASIIKEYDRDLFEQIKSEKGQETSTDIVTQSCELQSNNSMSFDELKRAGTTFFGWFGSWAYDQWLDLNDKYFEGENQVGPIIWGITPYGKSLGSYNPVKNIITLHTSLVQPSQDAPWNIKKVGEQFARGVLLHEMMHQRIYQFFGTTGEKDSHNNQYWVDEVNRILQILGIKDIGAIKVTQKRVNGRPSRDWVIDAGYLSYKELGQFPHCITDRYNISV